MNMPLFQEWFHDHFVPEVTAHLLSLGQETKALLLLDNCPCHPDVLETADKKFKCVFLPANTTSLIQPQDQGVIASMKKRYKTEMIKRYFASYSSNTEDSNPLVRFYKRFTIKDVIYMIAKIWDETPKTVLRNAWKNLKINLSEPVPPPEEVILPMQNIIPRSVMEAWAADPENDPGWEELTDEQIIDHFERQQLEQQLEQPLESDSESEEDETDAQDVPFNAKGAAEAAKYLRGFFEKQGKTVMARQMFDVEQEAIESMFNSKIFNSKQSTLNFFA